MADVYVEPKPKGGGTVTHYVLEYASDEVVPGTGTFRTQAAAASKAKQLGHQPLIARVRNTDKGSPDHWRAA